MPYRTCIALGERLVAKFPDEPLILETLANAYGELSPLVRKRGQIDEAIQYHERAATQYHALSQRFHHLDSEFKESAQHWNLGVVQRQRGQQPLAQANMRQSLEVLERLISQRPHESNFVSHLARRYFNLAAFLDETGQRDEAKSLMDKLAVLAPTDAETQESLVFWLCGPLLPLELRRGERALAVAQQLVEKQPSRPSAWTAMGHASFARGDHAAAVVAFDRARQLTNKELGLDDGLNMILALWRFGDRDQARRMHDETKSTEKRQLIASHDFQQVRDLVAEVDRVVGDSAASETSDAPSDSERLVQRARAALRLKLFDVALSYFAKLPADNVAALAGIGEAHAALGRTDDALRSFDAALALNPSDAALQLARARLLTALQQWNKAEAAWSAIIERNLDDGAAWLERAVTRQRLNQPEQAVADYDHVIALNPNDAASRLARARLLHGLKQWDKALTEYDEVLKLKPDDTQAWAARADLYFYPLRQHDKGIADYSEVIRLQPSVPQPFGRRGRAYMVLGQLDKATADINRSVELNSPVGETWYFCLLLRLHSDQTDDYAKLCSNLMERFGKAKDATTAASIARVCSLTPSALADPTQAVRLAEVALVIDPKSALFQNGLGLAHLRAGQHDEAIRRFNESLGATPKWVDPLNWLGLALAHHHLGQPDSAREWFTKADQWLDTNTKQLSKSSAGTPPPHGFHWLEIQLLHREAKAQLK